MAWGVWPGTSAVVNSESFNFTTSSAPAPVTDFDAATGSGSGEIDLSWTTPGDDGTTGDLTEGSQFLIKYSSDSAQDWGTMQYNWAVSTVVAHGTLSAHMVTGLLEETSYYFYIKTADESGIWAPLSNKTTAYSVDAVAPAPVTDLNAVTGSGAGKIGLSWTTTGEDGTTGDLILGSQFLIRYSSVASQTWDTPMDYNWYISTAVVHGTLSSHIVTGLSNLRQPHTRRTQLRPLRFPISRRFPRLRAWEAG